MKFVPRNEEEIKMSKLLTPGIYSYDVIDACEKNSKTTGKQMIELTLKVYNTFSKVITIKDYLIESMQLKLLNFAKSNNMEKEYENGEINASMCIHKMGKVEIDIQKGKEKSPGIYYDDRNVVKDYISDKSDIFYHN